MSTSSNDVKISNSDDRIIFCWMGPRQSDIHYTGLFDYSITLFGDGIEASKKKVIEQRDKKESIIEVREHLNYSFCKDSPLRFFVNGKLLDDSIPDPKTSQKEVRINHNETTNEQAIFLAIKQLELISQYLGDEDPHIVRFMNYNPNYVPMNFKNNPEFLFLSLSEDDLKKLIGKQDVDGIVTVCGDEVKAKDLELFLNLYPIFSDMKKSFIESILAIEKNLKKDKQVYDVYKEKVKQFRNDSNLEGVVYAYKAITIIRLATLCVNNKADLMKELNDKAEFRERCKNEHVLSTESVTLDDEDIGRLEKKSKDDFIKILRIISRNKLGSNDFVIQLRDSSGGNGTFVLKENENDPERMSFIHETLQDNLKDVVISKYRNPNVPINIHAIIGKREILLTKPSVQIVINRGGRLMYSGADYVAYDKYIEEHPSIDSELTRDVLKITTRLQSEGYRGVIGFDAIITKNGVEMVESNNRFQASTYLINRSYWNFGHGKNNNVISSKHNVPSIQALNLMAFLSDAYVDKKLGKTSLEYYTSNDRVISALLRRISSDMDINLFGEGGFTIPCNEIQHIPVNYSNYIYYNNPIGNHHAKMIHDLTVNNDNYDSCHDGFDKWNDFVDEFKPGKEKDCIYQKDAYIYKIIRKKSKTDVDFEERIRSKDNTDQDETSDDGIIPNIVSVLEDSVNIHPNIIDPVLDLRRTNFNSGSNRKKIKSSPGSSYRKSYDVLDTLDLKIQLVNKGVRLEGFDSGSIRKGVNYSIDLDVFIFGEYEHRFEHNGSWFNYLPINCPKDTEISKLSPFILKRDEGNTAKLYYYDKEIYYREGDDKSKIWVRVVNDELVDEYLSSGVPLRDICLFSTDRLRVQHSGICKFVMNGRGCQFCELTKEKSKGIIQLDESQIRANRLTSDDFKEAVEKAFEIMFLMKKWEVARNNGQTDDVKKELKVKRIFTHVLVGGATLPGPEGKMVDRIVEICEYIQEQKRQLRKMIENDGVYKDALENNLYFQELKASRSNGNYTAQDLVNEMSIYLMSIPPSSSNYLKTLHEHGVTQVSFNIEIHTASIAHRAMPGKSAIPISQYINALSVFEHSFNKDATVRECDLLESKLKDELEKLKGEPQSPDRDEKIKTIESEIEDLENRKKVSEIQQHNVRTAFIVGLDTEKGLMEGVSHVLSLGVSPILSIFRPCAGTPYQWMMPPSCERLYEIYRSISKECKKYKNQPGPDCIFCQNNTLAIPESLEPVGFTDKI